MKTKRSRSIKQWSTRVRARHRAVDNGPARAAVMRRVVPDG